MPLEAAVLPNSNLHLDAALTRAGAVSVPLEQARALIWTGSDQTEFPESLPATLEWVQLKSAGVRPWIDSGIIDPHRVWTSAVGAYSNDVAEHAVTLLLGCLHQLTIHARADVWLKENTWGQMRSLRGRVVAIVGAGSIGRAIIPLLKAHGVRVVAINRSGKEVSGADRTTAVDELNEVLTEADDAILAGASTDDTHQLIAAAQLRALGAEPRNGVPGILVNIARGDLIDEDALVTALKEGVISGAGLDVFDPEPLAPQHPLWAMDNVLITPHVATPKSEMWQNYATFVEENLRRFAAGQELRAVIDLERSY
jgi:D-2-hydroxyacid dehydrogenase (NADP+)